MAGNILIYKKNTQHNVGDETIAIIYCLIHILKTGKMTGSLSEDFGSCNYTDFVADAVGNCEKNFYISLALDQKADCR